MEKLRVYKKDLPYSYTLGPFPTFEIIEKRPQWVSRVILSKDFSEKEKMIEKLEDKGISYSFEDKTLERIGNRKKIFAAAVFDKVESPVEKGNHVLLEEVRDMGNLGSIIRTMAGFDFKNLVLLGNTCDPFHPKVIRGSMGSFFTIHLSCYKNLEEYKRAWPDQKIHGFLLNKASTKVHEEKFEEPFTLAFGNEGAGLSEDFHNEEVSPVFIPQSDQIDSLNLTLACGIAMYESRRKHV